MSESPAVPVVLSVVVPVYNEVRFLAALLDRIEAVPISKQVVVVADESIQGIREALAAFDNRDGFKVVFQQGPMGKGAALAEGFRHVDGSVVIVQDANLEYEPSEYPHLIAPILKGMADVVYGSRFAGVESRRVLYFRHSMGNKFLTLVSNMLTDLNLTDMETGYKVFRREILGTLSLRSRTFGIDPEITMKISRARYRIYEVPISYSGRTEVPGWNTGWKDAIEALWIMLYFRFLDRTPIPRVQLPPLTDPPSRPDVDDGSGSTEPQ